MRCGFNGLLGRQAQDRPPCPHQAVQTHEESREDLAHGVGRVQREVARQLERLPEQSKAKVGDATNVSQ
jgi:hypothetical protein